MKTQILLLLLLPVFLNASCHSKGGAKKEALFIDQTQREITSPSEPDSIRYINDDWSDFFRNEDIRTVDFENADTISLRFTPISEKQFSDFKSHQAGSNYGLTVAKEPGDTTFTITTQNTTYQFRDYGRQSHRYGGYIPEVNSHIIISCGEVCSGFLLDNETDEKMRLPDYFEGAILGILIPSSGKQMLLYASHHNADYEEYGYRCRARIFLLQIGEGKGFHRLANPRMCMITDWSIEEIVWVDDNSIALKAYSRYVEKELRKDYYVHDPEYRYFRTSIF